MQLLFVPVMLAVFAGGLTWWQTSSERTRLAEEAARQEALRAQYTAVQAYIDQMTSLVLQEDLRSSNDVQTIAQARTSGVLQAVEPENQRTLLQFLSEANLIQGRDADPPVISLDRADLSASDLRDIDLQGSNLSFANLRNANLTGANLTGAKLVYADLSGAELTYARGWTREQLQSARSLNGATMPDRRILQSDPAPDGPTFEEWLKG
jgi:uncharacterized protein YjbI with pentapeptide repeats